MDFTDWHVSQIEKRQAEDSYEAQCREREAGPRPKMAIKPYCFKCMAVVDWKPRVPYDWRLSRETTYEPGTDTKHICKPAPPRVDYAELLWRERNEQPKVKTTLRVGGKRVNL